MLKQENWRPFRYNGTEQALLRAAGVPDQLLDRLGVGFDGFHDVALLDQFLAGDDHPGLGGDTPQHQAVGRVVDQVDREEHHLVVVVDGADAKIAACGSASPPSAAG